MDAWMAGVGDRLVHRFDPRVPVLTCIGRRGPLIVCVGLLGPRADVLLELAYLPPHLERLPRGEALQA